MVNQSPAAEDLYEFLTSKKLVGKLSIAALHAKVTGYDASFYVFKGMKYSKVIKYLSQSGTPDDEFRCSERVIDEGGRYFDFSLDAEREKVALTSDDFKQMIKIPKTNIIGRGVLNSSGSDLIILLAQAKIEEENKAMIRRAQEINRQNLGTEEVAEELDSSGMFHSAVVDYVWDVRKRLYLPTFYRTKVEHFE